MTTLGPDATIDDIEDELAFNEVILSTLDVDSDDYSEKLAEVENTKRELEQRLEALQSGLPPQGMDGTSDQGQAFWQATMNGRPPSSDGGNRVVSGGSGVKRKSFSLKG